MHTHVPAQKEERVKTLLHATPLGSVEISCRDDGISGLKFVRRKPSALSKPHGVLRQCADQLEEYFSGTRRSFDVPVFLQGTGFQLKVWRVLQDIPWGQSVSYAELAATIGHPRSARAVGLAARANKIPLLVPCHRVIGSDGSLTGFSCGLWRKKWLLQHEEVGVDVEA